MIEVQVTNLTGSVVERGGFTFPPHSTKTVEAHEYSYKQLRACVYLKTARVKPQATVERPKDNQLFDCPYCDFIGKSMKSLLPHVRQTHPDKYEEFKAGDY